MTDFNQWLGNTQTLTDNICPILVRRMAATLGKTAPQNGEALPHLWQWMFFQAELTDEHLGRDGHPQLGEFLPPAEKRNRMWAGGELEFIEPLIVGLDAECKSTIEKIVEKHGSTGALLFVTVKHEYSQQGKLAVIERQNIVYREPSPPKLTSDVAPPADWQTQHTPNATQLFRYSAVTFNGHRIHYDYPYVTEVEGYPNLVVHGPMMATWALHGFIEANPDKTVERFSYRGVRPTTLPDAITIAGRLGEDNQAEVWISNDKGLIQQGKITYRK